MKERKKEGRGEERVTDAQEILLPFGTLYIQASPVDCFCRFRGFAAESDACLCLSPPSFPPSRLPKRDLTDSLAIHGSFFHVCVCTPCLCIFLFLRCIFFMPCTTSALAIGPLPFLACSVFPSAWPHLAFSYFRPPLTHPRHDHPPLPLRPLPLINISATRK